MLESDDIIFWHSCGYGWFEGVIWYNGGVDRSLEYTPYVIVQSIEVWWTRRSCVLENMIMEFGTYACLGCCSLIRWHKVLLEDMVLLCTLSIQGFKTFSNTCVDIQTAWHLSLSLLTTLRTIKVIRNLVWMTVGNLFGSLHNYLFIWFTFWSWLKFFSDVF